MSQPTDDRVEYLRWSKIGGIRARAARPF